MNKTSVHSSLTPADMQRYQRHLSLPGVGVAGQEKLKAARVLIIGAGGLGSPAAMYLVAAGVGHIGIADGDVVDASNLQRQLLHGEHDVGRRKVDSARERLMEINSSIEVAVYPHKVDASNVRTIISDYDVIIDGTDNLPTRYLLNDACFLSGKPWVYGAVHRFEGQIAVFWGGRGGCYRCLYPQPPPPGLTPNCADAGVLGVLPGLVGVLQATEAIKIIAGAGELLINRLLLIDAWTMRMREIGFDAQPDCLLCGKNTNIHETQKYVILKEHEVIKEITPRELKKRFDSNEKVMVVDVREPYELVISRLPGTKDIPLGQVLTRMDELDAKRDVVVMCRSGGRSARAIEELKKAGYAGPLINLKGGILAWSDEVDPSVAKY